MRHPRNILAVTVLALALCADRTVAASSSSHRPVAESLTAQIVRKFQQSFRRIVPAVDPFRDHAVTTPSLETPRFIAIESVVVAPLLSPFQFCLPPPVC